MSSYLEIGPGRGDFLFWLAAENPDKTVTAIEYKRKRFDKLVRRREAKDSKNVELYYGDAKIVIPQLFNEETFDKIFILRCPR